jgi:hypothetical protein
LWFGAWSLVLYSYYSVRFGHLLIGAYLEFGV